MLLILVALGAVLFGIIRLAQKLEPRQRIVLVLVVICALAYGVLKLMRMALLGRSS